MRSPSQRRRNRNRNEESNRGTIRRCGSCGERWKCRRRASDRQWLWRKEGQKEEAEDRTSQGKGQEEDESEVENKEESEAENEVACDGDDEKGENENENGNGWTSLRMKTGRSSKDTGSVCGQAVCSNGR